MIRRGIGIYVAVFALAFLSPAVEAAEEGEKAKPWERFSLNLGGYIAAMSSDVRIGSQTLGAGVDVNVEDALGLSSSIFVFRADASYRFTKNLRHRLDLNYYDLRRGSTKTLQSDIQIKDQVYTAGTTVDSVFDLKIIRAAYSYSLFQDDRFDLGLSVGAYVMPIKFQISSTNSGSSAQEAITAPLPVVGLRFDFAITPKLFLKQSFDFFYLQYENFQGSLYDIKVGFEYNIWKHVGVGLAYDFFRLQVKADGQNYPAVDMVGKIQFNSGGLLLYGKFFF